MCKGCGKKRVDLPKPTTWTLKEESEVTTGQWPLLEYIGIATSDMRFKGKTKRMYTFAANDFHRYKRVHPDDVPHLLRFPYFRQIKSVPTQGGDKTLVASPVPVKTEVVERIVPSPRPVMPTPTPIPIAIPEPKMIEIVEPNISMPDTELVDMTDLSVKKIKDKNWTPDEIRSIYRQELASPTPRVTIERWAEKEIEKLTSDFT